MGDSEMTSGYRVEYEGGFNPEKEEKLRKAVMPLKPVVTKGKSGRLFLDVPLPKGEQEEWDEVLSELPIGKCVEMEKGLKAARGVVARYRKGHGGSFVIRANGEGSRVWRIK
jgi:hypothetical protein